MFSNKSLLGLFSLSLIFFPAQYIDSLIQAQHYILCWDLLKRTQRKKLFKSYLRCRETPGIKGP
jgi:hypothetical protein